MKRRELEHLIRAAADIADDDEIIIIGSQAILGQFPAAAGELAVSMEADLYPKNRPERSDLIDGSIGEGSPFHRTFDYYAQGVDAATAILPDGWRGRLVPIRNENTRGATGWCLEVHDLVVSKYVAGRPKDARFIRVAIEQGLVDRDTLEKRLAATELAPEQRTRLLAKLRRDFGA